MGGHGSREHSLHMVTNLAPVIGGRGLVDVDEALAKMPVDILIRTRVRRLSATDKSTSAASPGMKDQLNANCNRNRGHTVANVESPIDIWIIAVTMQSANNERKSK